MYRKLQALFFFGLIFFLFLPLIVSAEETAITWYGQSAFKVVTPSGRVLIIDPWIVNPLNPHGARDLESMNKVDLILITHGHSDHIGNSIAIANKTGAKLVASYDLGRALVQYGGFPEKLAERSHMGFPGGELSLLNDEVRILFVPAVHSSSIEGAAGSLFSGRIVYGGTPGGFIIKIKNGPVIYHTGDTDIFSDMKLIGSFNKIDIMMACIGGHFTMDPQRAAYAVRLVNPSMVIPMHYAANPLLKGTPETFEKELIALHITTSLRIMKVGETYLWKTP
jgi:L-ascorbate metabolism protein UlaG (beta-lactamase superfamily)